MKTAFQHNKQQLQLNLCPQHHAPIVFWFHNQRFELQVPDCYQRSHQLLAAYCMSSLFSKFHVIPRKGHGVSIHEIHV